MNSSKDRIALVTGGSSGIGLGISRRLAADGFKVIVSGRDIERLKEACSRIGPAATYVRANVSKRHDVEEMAAQVVEGHGSIDVLVNNAGIMKTASLETPIEEAERIWDETIGINLKGMLLVSHAFAKHIATPGGKIVNMSSVVAYTGGSQAGMLAYTASKAGINGLTMALAREFAPRGITVNAVAPGMIDETGLTGTFDDERKARLKTLIPLGRPGLPDDVAGAVAWLVSPDSSYVTGAIISVNGGWRFG